MTKSLTLLVALLLAASVAWAGGEVQGKVKSWDSAGGTVTLEDGTMLSVPASIKERANIKEGATVKASFDEKDGKKVVSKIEVGP